MMTSYRKQAAFSIFLAFGLGAAGLRAQTPTAPRAVSDSRVDYESARREILGLESAINTVLAETFSNPFGLVNRTKGAYIPGYGQIFNFLINIQRAVVNTPFGEYRSGPTVNPAEKKQRIEELKDKLVRTLLAHAGDLGQLPQGESITIVAFFEDRNFPEQDKQDKTVVLSTLKKDLDEWAAKPGQWKEFKQRMKIVEY